jgi:hypothetical protein
MPKDHTAERQAGADDEIEMTPEMIEAGFGVLYTYTFCYPDADDMRDAVKKSLERCLQLVVNIALKLAHSDEHVR